MLFNCRQTEETVSDYHCVKAQLGDKQQKGSCAVLGRVRTETDGISRRTNEGQGRINGDKIPGLERSASYQADPALLSTLKTKRMK